MRTISISELELAPAKGAVWVLNSAASSEYEIIGDILISIPRGNGQPGTDPLKVPQTWLPVNIAEEFPRERLLASLDFRKAVNNELIKIISEDTAKAMLKQEGAIEEKTRLTEQKRMIRQAGAARTIQDSNVEISRADGVKEDEDGKVEIFGAEDMDNLAKQTKAGVEDNNGYRPQFLAFVDKIKGEPDIQALNAIKARAKFTRKELRYMRDQLPNHPKTTTALKKRILAFKEKSAA